MSAVAVLSPVHIIDPSELYRPEKEFRAGKPTFRDFSINPDDPIQERVRKTYFLMHTYQTVDFVRQRMACWMRFDKERMTVMDALEKLNTLIDESDPDVDLPNIVHAFQTAERIREAYPEEDWFHLTGLIHDLGKIMAVYGEAQWAVVGDTFPVGCAYADSIVFKNTSFTLNNDYYDPRYNTHLGMYQEKCGLENLTMSWSHDEYLYRVLKNHGTSLPEKALYMIRFHSFYPWHGAGDYQHLCSEKDAEMLEWVRKFNKFDLYSKADDIPDIEALKPYYQSLVDKYISPGPIAW